MKNTIFSVQLQPVNTNCGPGLVNTNLVPEPVNTNWGPGPVNTNLGPEPVNTNLGSGPGAKQTAGDREIQIPSFCRSNRMFVDVFIGCVARSY